MADHRMVFSANPGRSGSGYLASLLGACATVDAGHERLPAMVDVWLRRVSYHGAAESFEDRKMKTAAIRSDLKLLPDGVVYVDTSHMFVKTFGDVVLHEFDHELISVIVLRRNPIEVARSFFELDEFGPRRRPWHDFMPSPTAPGMIFTLAATEVKDQFDLIFGCLVDNVARTRLLQATAPSVTWIPAALDQITSAVGAKHLISSLDLVVPDDVEDRVKQRVNIKTAEKQSQKQFVPDGYIAMRLESFINRFATRPEVGAFVEHYEIDLRAQ